MELLVRVKSFFKDTINLRHSHFFGMFMLYAEINLTKN